MTAELITAQPGHVGTADPASRWRWPGRLAAPDIVLPAASIGVIAFMCFLWPAIARIPAPVGGSVLEASLPLFSPGHLLGTDLNGNDILSRLLHGGRVSLGIALAANAIGLLIGGTLGAVSGWLGGVVDSITMRILDVLIAFPSLILAIAVGQALGPSQVNTIWALAVFSIPAFARVARSAVLRLREQPFMVAADLADTGRLTVLARHVLPNIAPQLAELALLGMGIAITIEGALSFLGLGVPPPHPSWGNMIFQGQQALYIKPSIVLLPSVLLFASVLSLNLLGRALQVRWSRQ